MNTILGWLFKSYAQNLKWESDISLELKIEAFKATLDIKDLIRERMKGLRPNRSNDDTILNNHLAKLSNAERLVFLSKAKDVIDNPTFQIVLQSVLIDSEHKAMLESSDMIDVNFNRASINGAMLIEEDLIGLAKLYAVESRELPMTEEEKHSIIN